jgi:hypothetical protein
VQCKHDENRDVRKHRRWLAQLGLDGPILVPTEDQAEENTDTRGEREIK